MCLDQKVLKISFQKQNPFCIALLAMANLNATRHVLKEMKQKVVKFIAPENAQTPTGSRFGNVLETRQAIGMVGLEVIEKEQ